MTFLSALSSKPTHKEKKGQANTIHPGITNSKLKRKPQSAAGEEIDRRPAKQPKVFTTTPEEMVKIFGQYMQAQGANFGRRVQPARVMESIIGLSTPIESKSLLLNTPVQHMCSH
jgi:hypothetical protein